MTDFNNSIPYKCSYVNLPYTSDWLNIGILNNMCKTCPTKIGSETLFIGQC